MTEYDMSNQLWDIRGALLTTSNNDYTGNTTQGGAEINKVVDKMIEDALNRQVDFFPLVQRETINQLANIWNIRINLGSTNKSIFYTESIYQGTPYPSQKHQPYETAKSLRSDYEVSGLAMAASSSYMDVLADELKDAVDSHAIALEKTVLCGTDTSAYGFSGGFPGLLQLMGSYQYNSDTTTVHGTARASGKTYLDVQTVDASTGSLTLAMLDSAITKVNKAGGKSDRKIFLCSMERADEINQLLQAQQRFAGTTGMLDLEGGFSVSTYKNIPIVPALYMDLNGINSSGATYADNAMYLVNLDRCAFFDVNGVFAMNVALPHSSNSGIRYDFEGGYIKTYGAFRLKEFTKHCAIVDLATPA